MEHHGGMQNIEQGTQSGEVDKTVLPCELPVLSSGLQIAEGGQRAPRRQGIR
jgi:hypothetical protein